MNNDLFSTRAQPELKTCCYFALMIYVTTILTKTTAAQNEDALSYHRVRGIYFLAVVLWAVYISYLISSLEVSLPLRGMLAFHYSYNCFIMRRPRDTISAQTMACHQSRVWGGVSWLCAQNCENNIILSYYFTVCCENKENKYFLRKTSILFLTFTIYNRFKRIR